MWAYTRAAFRVVDLGLAQLRLRPGILLVASHRAETDVPLLCPSLYRAGHFLRDREAPRINFAARDDMFDRGFFAGFPPGLPLAARRLLYPLEAGSVLPRVRVHPVPYPSASLLRLGRALAAVPPDAPLELLLPPELLEQLGARAREAGVRAPRTAVETLHGVFADLLWQYRTSEQLSAPAFEPAWRRRAEESAAAIRRLVELVASGEILLLFPEGRPSPDGAVGPLRKGLGTIVRRGRPEAIVPIAIAYDPLTPYRPRAYVAFGLELVPPAGGVDEALLRALRRATPLTCGQVVARELVRAASTGVERVGAPELDVALADECAAAVAEGRPVDRALLGVPTRRERLSEALAWVVRSGLVTAPDRRSLVLAPERVLADGTVLRIAREHESARDLAG